MVNQTLISVGYGCYCVTIYQNIRNKSNLVVRLWGVSVECFGICVRIGLYNLIVFHILMTSYRKLTSVCSSLTDFRILDKITQKLALYTSISLFSIKNDKVPFSLTVISSKFEDAERFWEYICIVYYVFVICVTIQYVNIYIICCLML